jgi:hypothetical protein
VDRAGGLRCVASPSCPGPIALPGDRIVPTRDHLHTVVRTPNGNDYGQDLLRQHLEAHRNDPAHRHRRD